MLALLPLSGTEMSFLGVLAHGLYHFLPAVKVLKNLYGELLDANVLKLGEIFRPALKQAHWTERVWFSTVLSGIRPYDVIMT